MREHGGRKSEVSKGVENPDKSNNWGRNGKGGLLGGRLESALWPILLSTKNGHRSHRD